MGLKGELGARKGQTLLKELFEAVNQWSGGQNPANLGSRQVSIWEPRGVGGGGERGCVVSPGFIKHNASQDARDVVCLVRPSLFRFHLRLAPLASACSWLTNLTPRSGPLG